MKVKYIFWLIIISSLFWFWLKSGVHIVYGLKLLKGQATVIYQAEPIQNRLDDPLFPDSLKRKISLIQQVRQFAVDSLGFGQTNNYRTYFQEPNHTLLWMLTGCKPHSFEEKEWCFPLVGCFGYIGFFDSTAALQEIELLKLDGFEPDLGPVAAWSTLGILPDPILSSMLKKEDWKLIQLVFHELTHTVVYAKNAVDFNENLANFIGDKATIKFIKHKAAGDTVWQREIEEAMNDRRLFLSYMYICYQKLDSVYLQMPANQSLVEKERIKALTIDSLFETFKTLPLKHPQRYSYFLTQRQGWTNNVFLGYRRYDFDRPQLEIIYKQQAGSNLKAFVSHMKMKYGSRGLFDFSL